MEENARNERGRTGVLTSVAFIFLIIVMLLCLFFQRRALLESGFPFVEGILPVVMLLAGGLLLKLLKEDSHVVPLIFEGGALFCGLCFYMTGIFLFLLLQKDEILISGLVFPALLMLTVIYISRSFLTVLFYEVFCGIYIFLSQMPEKRYIFLCMLLFLLPYGVELYREKGGRAAMMFFEAATASVGLLFFYVSPNSAAFGIWVFNLYAYLLIVLLLHYRFYPVATPYFASPMKITGIAGIMLLWAFSSQAERWQNGVIPGADWPVNVEFFILLLGVCVLFSENLLRGRVNIEQMLFCAGYYVSFGLYIFFEFHSPQLIGFMNGYFIFLIFVCCASGLGIGLRKRDRFLFSLWGGASMIWAASFFIYNDYLYRAVVLGLVLALAAASAIRLVRRRLKT